MKKRIEIGSVVLFRIVDEDEVYSKKVVEKLSAGSSSEISCSSALGEALMFCAEGDVALVKADEPYKVEVLNISNAEVKQKVFEDRNIKAKNVVEKIEASGEVPLAEIFVPAVKTNYASFVSKIDKILESGKAYGTKALDIYISCVDAFGWDAKKAISFDLQKLLFSKRCTKEGYSVWFLPYSNIHETSKINNWKNIVNSDFNQIREYWRELDEGFYDKEKRVTFVKQQDGKYLFIGIFEAVVFDQDRRYKEYRQIAATYEG
jgi:hypothetical protein